MTTAAIYCRVSTEKQEEEGTSLDTQLEACLKYCKSKNYDVASQYLEAYSGLSLERPELNKLRDLVRKEQVDVIVIYCLDRLSRNATHGVILRDEFDKHHVGLESVTEDIDKTPLGQAITYLRGTFSQIEAEKIRERTMRGKKANAISGNLQHGGFSSTYGYDYIPRIDKEHPPKRVVNEVEARIVRQIFSWMVDDRLSTWKIAEKLKESKIPAKRKDSKHWCQAGVRNIIKNTSYFGKAIAYQKTDKVEIPCPAIISEELYQAAQRQLTANKTMALRNTKRQYLLRGFIRCTECGHAYYGRTGRDRINGERITDRRYMCSGKLAHLHPITGCKNKSWQADDLERRVWAKIEKAIKHPDTIFEEFRARQENAANVDIYLDELNQLNREIKKLDRDQDMLLRKALRSGFREDSVKEENKRINSSRDNLNNQKTQLEARIEAGKSAIVDMERANEFIKFLQSKIENADFDQKRLALEMLDITVWIEGKRARIKGAIGSDIVIKRTISSIQNSIQFEIKI